MIPKTGWRDMESAPTDGTIIFLISRQYNSPNGPAQVQPGHWLCDGDGKNWGWKRPWAPGWTVYADGWMTVEEFYRATAHVEEFDIETPADEPHHVKAAREIGDCFDEEQAAEMDFDL